MNSIKVMFSTYIKRFYSKDTDVACLISRENKRRKEKKNCSISLFIHIKKKKRMEKGMIFSMSLFIYIKEKKRMEIRYNLFYVVNLEPKWLERM